MTEPKPEPCYECVHGGNRKSCALLQLDKRFQDPCWWFQLWLKQGMPEVKK